MFTRLCNLNHSCTKVPLMFAFHCPCWCEWVWPTGLAPPPTCTPGPNLPIYRSVPAHLPSIQLIKPLYKASNPAQSCLLTWGSKSAPFSFFLFLSLFFPLRISGGPSRPSVLARKYSESFFFWIYINKRILFMSLYISRVVYGRVV